MTNLLEIDFFQDHEVVDHLLTTFSALVQRKGDDKGNDALKDSDSAAIDVMQGKQTDISIDKAFLHFI